MRNEFESTYPMEREEEHGKRVRPSLHRRVLYGIIACTLVAWAAIGLLTGHMYVLAGGGGGGGGLVAVPFRGAAAWLFSAGVLAIASRFLLDAANYFGCWDSGQARQRFNQGIYGVAGALPRRVDCQIRRARQVHQHVCACLACMADERSPHELPAFVGAARCHGAVMRYRRFGPVFPGIFHAEPGLSTHPGQWGQRQGTGCHPGVSRRCSSGGADPAGACCRQQRQFAGSARRPANGLDIAGVFDDRGVCRGRDAVDMGGMGDSGRQAETTPQPSRSCSAELTLSECLNGHRARSHV